MKNVILASAQGEMTLSWMFRLFVKSWYDRLRNIADLVLVSGDMPKPAKGWLDDLGVIVVDYAINLKDYGNIARHYCFADVLHSHQGRWDMVLTADARDSFFQSDPFAYGDSKSILFSAEAGDTNEDRWNENEWQLALKNFSKLNHIVCFPKNRSIINGGFVRGPQAAMAALSSLRFLVHMQGGTFTDQGSLMAITSFFERWPGFKVVDWKEPWIFHGHWFKKLIDYGGKFLNDMELVSPEGGVYAVFHQYDRTPLSKRMKSKETVACEQP